MLDLLDATELREAEVREVAASEGVFLCPCCSIELSEAVCIECDSLVGEGGSGSEGSLLISRPEMPLVIKFRVVLGSWGTLIPSSSAVCRKC